MTPRGIGADEHARFERPTGRSRPRTKVTPDYSDAELGMVITIDRGRYTCLVGDRKILATKARRLGREGVIVGDRVRLVGDTSGDPDALARIVEVLDRRTQLRRTADDLDPHERPIVANADQLVIVSALADPPPRIGMIDRCLAAGFDAGLKPLLCLTKSDLAAADDVIANYAPLEVLIEVTRPDRDITSLRDRLIEHDSVFIGHSGVGKSTLINALIPEAGRATGSVSTATGRGRHVSTSAYALPLPDTAGWVIDTPGVRSFGLSHISTERILATFNDLDTVVADCPRGCTHTGDQTKCALDTAIADGELSPTRVESVRRMISASQ